MRNKSCPIVTFQTERKRKLVPRFAIARGSAIGSPLAPLTLRLAGQHHGKRKVKNRRAGCRVETRLRPRGKATFHSVGRNCGIPATGSKDYRIGPLSAWKYAALFVT